MFRERMVTPAIPERVFALCKIVEKKPIFNTELKEKMEPEYLHQTSSYYSEYRTAAEELKLITISDNMIYFLIILFYDFGDNGDNGDKWETLEGVPGVFVCLLENKEEKCRKARKYRLSEDFGRISHLSPLSPNLSPRGVWGQERGHVKSP